MEPEITERYPELEYNPVITLVRTRAMDQLKNIVGTSGLRHDIKRIRQAESLKGATKWANKHSNRKTKYIAEEEDIDNDGVQDVLVKTQDGGLVIVNGYTVRRSDYPYRQMFAGLPKSVRKEHGNYRNYLKTIYGPTYDDRTGEITSWKQNPDEDERYRRIKNSGFATYTPKNLSTYQLFCKQIVAPTIKGNFEAEPELYAYEVPDSNGDIVQKMPPITFEVNADAWNYGVVKPIIETVLKSHIPDDIGVDDLKTLCSHPDIVKFKKSREFKERSNTLVRQYIVMDDEVGTLIENLINRIFLTMNETATRWKEANVKPL